MVLQNLLRECGDSKTYQLRLFISCFFSKYLTLPRKRVDGTLNNPRSLIVCFSLGHTTENML